jgi:hypothetical protein
LPVYTTFGEEGAIAIEWLSACSVSTLAANVFPPSCEY